MTKLKKELGRHRQGKNNSYGQIGAEKECFKIGGGYEKISLDCIIVFCG